MNLAPPGACAPSFLNREMPSERLAASGCQENVTMNFICLPRKVGSASRTVIVGGRYGGTGAGGSRNIAADVRMARADRRSPFQLEQVLQIAGTVQHPYDLDAFAVASATFDGPVEDEMLLESLDRPDSQST